MSTNNSGGSDRNPSNPILSSTDLQPSEHSGSIRVQSLPDYPAADPPSQTGSESGSGESTPLTRFARQVPDQVAALMRVHRDRRDKCYLQIGLSSTVFDLDGDAARAQILAICAHAGKILKSGELEDTVAGLRSAARLKPPAEDVCVRVAQLADRVILDVGDEQDTRIEISASGVRIVSGLASPLFVRPSSMRPMTIPAESGDLDLLDGYLNMNAVNVLLVKAYASYIIAHGKREGTAFPILVVGGSHGCGKSVFSRILQQILDPSGNGIQAFPRHVLDLLITLQQSHVSFFDNVRDVSQSVSDILCVAVIGGTVPVRRLYSDAGQFLHQLHGAIVINGLHWFIGEPDLAQRCIYMEVKRIDSSERQSEQELLSRFRGDLPAIFRGLLDLVSQVLLVLPKVKPSAPERMYDFSAWLAAMEKVHGVPEGVYQGAYSENVREGMRDALLEDPMAEALMDLVRGSQKSWSGTPSELLIDLTELASRRTLYSREWPNTASALSKRIRSLEAGLARQGIIVRFTRGRERQITIDREQGVDHG